MDVCEKCGSKNTFHNFEGFDCLDCGHYNLDEWVKKEEEN